MAFELRPVEAGFLDTAPWRWVNTAEIAVPAAKVFAAFEDGESWPVWFKGIKKVTWTSPKPFGVGTTRTVVLDTLTVQEHFFRWEPGRRVSFYMTTITLPLVQALAEDYLLEDNSSGGCRFTYTVAAQPTLGARVLGPALRWNFGRMFAGAAKALPTYMGTRA